MERREFIALLGVAAAAMPSAARAERSCPVPATAEHIVGSWAFVSSVNTRTDGTSFDRWGANPKGVLMFDSGGNYSQIIVGSESRMFGAKTFCAFGTYSVEAGNKTLITRVNGCSISRYAGIVQERQIVLLSADELKYINPLTAMGTTAEVAWKRLS